MAYLPDWDYPAVLSGMSSLEQMEDNLSSMRDFKGLTPQEQKTLDAAQREINRIPLIPCTACNYCAKVCPNNIGISRRYMAATDGARRFPPDRGRCAQPGKL